MRIEEARKLKPGDEVTFTGTTGNIEYGVVSKIVGDSVGISWRNNNTGTDHASTEDFSVPASWVKIEKRIIERPGRSIKVVDIMTLMEKVSCKQLDYVYQLDIKDLNEIYNEWKQNLK